MAGLSVLPWRFEKLPKPQVPFTVRNEVHSAAKLKSKYQKTRSNNQPSLVHTVDELYK